MIGDEKHYPAPYPYPVGPIPPYPYEDSTWRCTRVATVPWPGNVPLRPLHPDEHAQVVAAGLALVEAAHLDHLWTTVTSGESLTDDKRAAVIGTALDASLNRCAPHILALGAIIEGRPLLLRQRLLDYGTAIPAPAEFRRSARSFASQGGGIVEAATTGNERLRHILEDERALLRSKVDALRSGDGTTGDLSKEAACRIAGQMLVSGLLAAETGVGAFIAGFGAGVLIGMEIWGGGC